MTCLVTGPVAGDLSVPLECVATAGLTGTGSRFLLGADRGEFALDSSADRGIGPQGLQAPRELVAVQVQLAGNRPIWPRCSSGPAVMPAC
jgi:hypothetical protein